MEKIKKLLFALGVNDEDLKALENDEKAPDMIASAVIDRTENNVKTRIGESVAEDKKSEIFNAVYNKVQTLLKRNFAERIDASKYKDKKDAVKLMIEDLRGTFDDERAKLENAAAGDAAIKLDDYRARLNEANGMIDKIREETAAAIAAKDAEFVGYKNKQAINGRVRSLLSGVQNSRFEAETMADIFEAERRRRSINFKLDDDGETVIAVDADGRAMRNPEKPSENLTINAVFDSIARDRKFVKESQGTEERRRVTIEANGENGTNKVPAAFAEYLNKNGISL